MVIADRVLEEIGLASGVAFDTCICGLTALPMIAEATGIQRWNFIADYSVNPLGIKTRSEVVGAGCKWIEMAGSLFPECLTIAIACNTVSTALAMSGYSAYIPNNIRRVVTMSSLAKVVLPLAIGKLFQSETYIKAAVVGTKATIQSQYFQELVKDLGGGSGIEPIGIAATLMEATIARGKYILEPDLINEAAMQELGPYKDQYDLILLACTCFPLLYKIFKSALCSSEKAMIMTPIGWPRTLFPACLNPLKISVSIKGIAPEGTGIPILLNREFGITSYKILDL